VEEASRCRQPATANQCGCGLLRGRASLVPRRGRGLRLESDEAKDTEN